MLGNYRSISPLSFLSPNRLRRDDNALAIQSENDDCFARVTDSLEFEKVYGLRRGSVRMFINEYFYCLINRWIFLKSNIYIYILKVERHWRCNNDVSRREE